jgi:hypothetical protein
VGKDGRIYAVDLARLFPPVAENRKRKGGFLYRLFRPEFVRNYSTPLCSDACSPFAEDPNDPQQALRYQQEIEEATAFLKQKLIIECAANLRHRNIPRTVVDPIRLVLLHIHTCGINLRYLPRVRRHCTDEEIRRILLLEMVARATKFYLGKKIRGFATRTSSQNGPLDGATVDVTIQDARRKKVVVRFFRRLFADSVQSKRLWKRLVKAMRKKFGSRVLEENEIQQFKSDWRWLGSQCGSSRIIERVSTLLGLVFESKIYEKPQMQQLQGSHLLSIKAQVKQLFFITFHEAFHLHQEVLEAIHYMDEQSKKHTISKLWNSAKRREQNLIIEEKLHACNEKYITCLEEKPGHNPLARHNWSLLLKLQAERLLSLSSEQRNALLELSREQKQIADLEMPSLKEVERDILYRNLDIYIASQK